MSGSSAGVQASLTIRAADSFGNVLSTGGANFAIQVGRLVFGTATTLPSSAVSVTDSGDGSYVARYLTTEAAAYSIAVTLLGKHALGSPLSNVVVVAGSVNASACTARGAGLVGGSVGRPSTYFIRQRDAYGNVNTNQASGFSVTATPPAAGGPTLGSFDSSKGEWTVTYTYATAITTAQQTVTFGGVSISGSPFTGIRIVSSLGSADASKCYIFGGALQENSQLLGSVGTPVSFSIQAANSAGINLVGEASDPAGTCTSLPLPKD